jgi:16S rRNA (guanine966-N2)-methyltransferase
MLFDEITGKNVLDLFSGSGSLSFEAMSRGASSAILIDSDPVAVSTTIENILRFNLQDKMRCYLNKFDVAIKLLKNQKKEFDIIFIDPPYFFVNYGNILDPIYDSKLLSKDGLIVLEHKKNIDVVTDKFILKKEKIFGSTVIKIFGVI